MPRKKKVDPDDEFAEFETKEEKEEKKKLRKQQELDDDSLPESGLYNADNFLFYHSSIKRLTKPQKARAAEHGLNLHKKLPFTLEECVQIFKNWRQFAEEHTLKLDGAEEYVGAKQIQKHIILHQKNNFFWPKLCNGMPHRTAQHVKQRSELMLTDDFLKTLNWDNLEEEVRQKYFTHEAKYEEHNMQKVKKLIDRGYSMVHVAELLKLSARTVVNMGTKLKRIDERDDPKMVSEFFEAAQSFGLDFGKVHEYLKSSNEFDYNLLYKTIRVKAMSVKIHMSQSRIREFLRTFLGKIWTKYHEEVENDERSEKEKYEEAMQVISTKPPLTDEQRVEFVEILCKNMRKDEKMSDLLQREELVEMVKAAGITDFACNAQEFPFLHFKISQLMLPLHTQVFQHLRHEIRPYVRLHILLWTLKIPFWYKLEIDQDGTRYGAVLRHEMANPLVSRTTLKFLKHKKFAEYIMEPRNLNRRVVVARRDAGIELFILYAYQRYHGEFKFPAKLASLVPESNRCIRRILKKNSEDPEDVDGQNSEYLTTKDVKKTVEEGTGLEMLTKVSSKLLMAKEELHEDSDEDVDSESLDALLTHAKQKEAKWLERSEKEIREVLDRADPNKIVWKCRRRPIKNSEDEDEDEAYHVSDEILEQNRAMRAVAKRWEAGAGTGSSYKSKEYLGETSDEDDDEDLKDSEAPGDSEDAPDCQGASEGVGKAEEQGEVEFEVNGDVLEDSEGVEGAKKHRKSKRRDSEGPEAALEDVEKSKKSKKSKKHDSEVAEDVPEGSEDVEKSKKHRKFKKLDSEDVVTANMDFDGSDEGQGTSEDVGKTKKSKKSKKQVSEVVEDVPEDSEDVEKPKKSKKSKNRDSEAPEAPDDSEDVEKSKKRKHRDSEDVEAPGAIEKPKKQKKSKNRDPEDAEDAPEDSEDVEKSKKHVEEDSEAPEALEESEGADSSSKKHKKSKKRKRQDSEDAPEGSEDVRPAKKQKRKDSEVPEANGDPEAPEAPEAPEDATTSHKKHKKSKKHAKEDSEEVTMELEEDPEARKKEKKAKKARKENSEDVEDSESREERKKKKKKKRRDSNDVEGNYC